MEGVHPEVGDREQGDKDNKQHVSKFSHLTTSPHNESFPPET